MENQDHLYDLGITLLEEGQAAEALSLFQSAAGRFPQNVKLLLGLGVACQVNGRTGEAETHIANAIRLEPDAADFHASLGDLYSGTGEQEKARQAYQTAVRLDPAVPAYYMQIGCGSSMPRIPISAAGTCIDTTLAFSAEVDYQGSSGYKLGRSSNSMPYCHLSPIWYNPSGTHTLEV